MFVGLQGIKEKNYDALQPIIDAIPLQDKIIILGDINRQIGSTPYTCTTHRFDEDLIELVEKFMKIHINAEIK